eukprot:scaffold7381_cov310-Pinguiococcus_pyrenoidosus.AAC.62
MTKLSLRTAADDGISTNREGWRAQGHQIMGRACFPLLCLQVQNLPCRTRPPTENICDPGPRSSVMRSPFIIGQPRYKHSIYNIAFITSQRIRHHRDLSCGTSASRRDFLTVPVVKNEIAGGDESYLVPPLSSVPHLVCAPCSLVWIPWAPHPSLNHPSPNQLSRASPQMSSSQRWYRAGLPWERRAFR